MASMWFQPERYFNNLLTRLQTTEPNAGWTAESLAANLNDSGYIIGGTTPEAIRAAGDQLERHFNQVGNAENVSPNDYFDVNYYIQQKILWCQQHNQTPPDGYSEWTPDSLWAAMQIAGIPSYWDHYILWGTLEGINPSAQFNTNEYLTLKLAQLNSLQPPQPLPDGSTGTWTRDLLCQALREGHMNALEHYMAYNESEHIGYNPEPENPIGTKQLTTGADEFGDDGVPTTFEGTVAENSADSTLNPGDKITGTMADDQLKVQLNADFDGFADGGFMKGVQTVNVTNGVESGPVTWNATGTTGVKNYEVNGFVNLENLPETGITVDYANINNRGAGNAVIGFASAGGSNDSLTVNVGENVGWLNFQSDGIENVTVNSNQANTNLNIYDKDMQNLVLKGDTVFNIRTMTLSTKSLDMRALSSDGNFVCLSRSEGVNSILGGSGDDSVSVRNLAPNAVVDGGAGEDSVKLRSTVGSYQLDMRNVETLNIAMAANLDIEQEPNADPMAALFLDGTNTTGLKTVGIAGGNGYTFGNNSVQTENARPIYLTNYSMDQMGVKVTGKNYVNLNIDTVKDVTVNVGNGTANDTDSLTGSLTLTDATTLAINTTDNNSTANGGQTPFQADVNAANVSNLSLGTSQGSQIDITGGDLSAVSTLNVSGFSDVSIDESADLGQNAGSLTVNNTQIGGAFTASLAGNEKGTSSLSYNGSSTNQVDLTVDQNYATVNVTTGVRDDTLTMTVNPASKITASTLSGTLGEGDDSLVLKSTTGSWDGASLDLSGLTGVENYQFEGMSSTQFDALVASGGIKFAPGFTPQYGVNVNADGSTAGTEPSITDENTQPDSQDNITANGPANGAAVEGVNLAPTAEEGVNNITVGANGLVSDGPVTVDGTNAKGTVSVGVGADGAPETVSADGDMNLTGGAKGLTTGNTEATGANNQTNTAGNMTTGTADGKSVALSNSGANMTTGAVTATDGDATVTATAAATGPMQTGPVSANNGNAAVTNDGKGATSTGDVTATGDEGDATVTTGANSGALTTGDLSSEAGDATVTAGGSGDVNTGDLTADNGTAKVDTASTVGNVTTGGMTAQTATVDAGNSGFYQIDGNVTGTTAVDATFGNAGGVKMQNVTAGTATAAQADGIALLAARAGDIAPLAATGDISITTTKAYQFNAGTIDANGGTVTLNFTTVDSKTATSADKTYKADGSVTIDAVNAGTATIKASGAEGAVTISAGQIGGTSSIETGAANDTITVTALADATLSVSTGKGDDTVNVTAQEGSKVTVNPGTGADKVTVTAQKDSTVTLNATDTSATAGAQSLTVQGDASLTAADSFTVKGTINNANATVNLNGGKGGLDVAFGTSGLNVTAAKAVNITAGAGTDTFTGTINSAMNLGTLALGTGDDTATLTLGKGVSKFTLDLGAGKDTATLTLGDQVTGLTVKGGTGADNITINGPTTGTADLTLSGLSEADDSVSIVGKGGTLTADITGVTNPVAVSGTGTVALKGGTSNVADIADGTSAALDVNVAAFTGTVMVNSGKANIVTGASPTTVAVTQTGAAAVTINGDQAGAYALNYTFAAPADATGATTINSTLDAKTTGNVTISSEADVTLGGTIDANSAAKVSLNLAGKTSAAGVTLGIDGATEVNVTASGSEATKVLLNSGDIDHNDITWNVANQGTGTLTLYSETGHAAPNDSQWFEVSELNVTAGQGGTIAIEGEPGVAGNQSNYSKALYAYLTEVTVKGGGTFNSNVQLGDYDNPVEFTVLDGTKVVMDPAGSITGKGITYTGSTGDEYINASPLATSTFDMGAGEDTLNLNISRNSPPAKDNPITVSLGANDGDADTVSVYMGGSGDANAYVIVNQFEAGDSLKSSGPSGTPNSIANWSGDDAEAQFMAALKAFGVEPTGTLTTTDKGGAWQIAYAGTTAYMFMGKGVDGNETGVGITLTGDAETGFTATAAAVALVQFNDVSDSWGFTYEGSNFA